MTTIPALFPTDDGTFDCLVALAETGMHKETCRDMTHMRLHWEHLHDSGLLEPDEPHPYWHALEQQRLGAPFNPEERHLIRLWLGLDQP